MDIFWNHTFIDKKNVCQCFLVKAWDFCPKSARISVKDSVISMVKISEDASMISYKVFKEWTITPLMDLTSLFEISSVFSSKVRIFRESTIIHVDSSFLSVVWFYFQIHLKVFIFFGWNSSFLCPGFRDWSSTLSSWYESEVFNLQG